MSGLSETPEDTFCRVVAHIKEPLYSLRGGGNGVVLASDVVEVEELVVSVVEVVAASLMVDRVDVVVVELEVLNGADNVL